MAGSTTSDEGCRNVEAPGLPSPRSDAAVRGSHLGELDDHLDVVRRPLQGARKVVRALASRHELSQPGPVCTGQGFSGLVPVPLVGIDAPDEDVVPQYRPSRHVCRGWPDSVAASANAGETHDAARPNGSNRVGNHLPDARAFHDDVRLESDFSNGAGVVAGPEGADELRLGSRIGPIENMNVQTALLSEEGSEKTDRPSPGDQHGPGLPEGALTDHEDLFPGLGDDGCGLQQDTEEPE